jgi:hypothetical protein
MTELCSKRDAVYAMQNKPRNTMTIEPGNMSSGSGIQYLDKFTTL